MTIRKVVIGLGLALMPSGYGRLLERDSKSVPARPGCTGCRQSFRARFGPCVQTLMSYSWASSSSPGLIIAVIASPMIAKQERLDLHGELEGSTSAWAKPQLRAASVGPSTDRVEASSPPALVSAPDLNSADADGYVSSVTGRVRVHSMNPIRGLFS